jgi:hypothetical protein
MTKGITHIGNTGAKSFGEAETPVSRPAGETREPVILIHRPSSAAASDGLGDAIEPELGFESLGSIAIRLFAQWKLPRMQMSLEPARERRDGPHPSEVSGRKTDRQD